MRYWTLYILLFEWCDFWVGIYWDKKKRKLYILPIPMFGIAIQFGSAPENDTRGQHLADFVREGADIECPDCRTICHIYRSNSNWEIICKKCLRMASGPFSRSCFKEFGGKINGLEVEKIFPDIH